MNIIGIIPSRLNAKRLPNKPLADINGMPMIGHVYKRSKLCQDLSEVYVATCDQEIADYIDSIGGKYIMTSDLHQSAFERTAEALQLIEKETGEEPDIVVLIQGDEPMVTPQMLSNSISPIIMDDEVPVANLMAEIKSDEEFFDRNEIKVVVDVNNYALYFSREPIPSSQKGVSGFPKMKVISITPFRRNFLIDYHMMMQSPLEITESIDLMRIIENGYRVRMVMTESETYSVDTQEDLEKVRELLKSDYYVSKYTN